MHILSPHVEVVSHVEKLRRMVRVAVTCPKCNRRGVVSVLRRGRYRYLVVRHGDGSTHTLTRHIDVVLAELCRIRKELEHVCNLKGA